MPPKKVTTTREMNGITFLSLEVSKVYQEAVPAFQKEVKAMLKKKPAKVVVDLGNVEIINSAGLGVLIALQDSMEAYGGKLVITGLSKMLRQLFNKMRLNKLFVVSKNEQEALGSF